MSFRISRLEVPAHSDWSGHSLFPHAASRCARRVISKSEFGRNFFQRVYTRSSWDETFPTNVTDDGTHRVKIDILRLRFTDGRERDAASLCCHTRVRARSSFPTVDARQVGKTDPSRVTVALRKKSALSHGTIPPSSNRSFVRACYVVYANSVLRSNENHESSGSQRDVTLAHKHRAPPMWHYCRHTCERDSTICSMANSCRIYIPSINRSTRYVDPIGGRRRQNGRVREREKERRREGELYELVHRYRSRVDSHESTIDSSD